MKAPPAAPSPGALEMSVPAQDGLILKGTLSYPSGRQAQYFPLAILAHQYPATRDSYAPLVADLLDRGAATLAFDQRGHGASIQRVTGDRLVIDTPAGFAPDAFANAFLSSAHRVGFHRMTDDIIRVAAWGAAQNFVDRRLLLLVGASVGGVSAILAAPSVAGLAAVLTLGAAGALVHGADGPERVRATVAGLQVPCFLASSEGDPFEGGLNVRTWAAGHPHVSACLIPGSAHAMAIYFEVREPVLAFVSRALGLPG